VTPAKHMTRRQQHQAVLKMVRADYDKMLRAQGGRCALCPSVPKNRRFHIDHDHRLMVARGLLCHRCNRTLASWVTPGWLRAAALYLEYHESRAERRGAHKASEPAA
jgi:hypothetical protein